MRNFRVSGSLASTAAGRPALGSVAPNRPRPACSAVRLALAGSRTASPALDIQCIGTAPAFCDRVQIEQVAFNLVRNATEAIGERGRGALTIATELLAGG